MKILPGKLNGPRRQTLTNTHSTTHFRALTRIMSVGVLLIAGPAAVSATDDEEFGFDEPVFIENTGKSTQARHKRLTGTRSLHPDEAEIIYKQNADALHRDFRSSIDPIARRFSNWERANTKPYPSFSHGRRYLNNYLNQKAENYLKYERAGRLPVGAIIAKDSFAVDQSGAFMPGPLFIMEKMPAGFNYVSGDWRYTLIQPDGSISGSTNGENADNVKFCVSCHLAAEKKDHLFFVPNEFRR